VTVGVKDVVPQALDNGCYEGFEDLEPLVSTEDCDVTVGVKDVVPQALDNGCYEGFEDLVDRANVWLKEQKNDNIVINMQSIMVLKDDGQ